jgi:hypothetical protein
MPSDFDDYDEPHRSRERDHDSDERPRRRREPRDPPPAQATQVSVLGILSIVQGGGALVTSFIPCVGVFAIVTGVIGLILGVIGISVAKNSGGRQAKTLPVIGTSLNGAAIAIGCVWVLLLNGLFDWGKRPNPDGRETITISAADLDREYRFDKEVADGRFRDRSLSVTGVVKRVPANRGLSIILVELEGSTDDTMVECEFPREKWDEVKTLAAGETVLIDGRCRGRILDEPVRLERCVLMNRPARDAEKPAGKDNPPDAPPIGVTAEQLAEDYDGNVVAADTKYKGKLLEVTGKVVRVVRTRPGKITVELDDEAGSTVDCDFQETDGKAQLVAVKVGEEVVIRGTCLGEQDDYVTLGNCTLVKK